MNFPLCDYSHKDKDWSCVEQDIEAVGDLFVAADHLTNYAEKLAFELSGLSLHRLSGEVFAQRLIVLTDGLSIAKLKRQCARVHWQELIVIGIGIEASLLKHAFRDARIKVVSSKSLPQIWVDLKKSLYELDSPEAMRNIPDLFCSHAIADEAFLYPAIKDLREAFGFKVFLCADSIRQGEQWRRTIFSELRNCELFLFCASKAASSSLFCSFELGMAIALEKSIRIVNLDSTPLPASISDLQAIELSRLSEMKPWLTHQQLLADAILKAVQQD